MSKTMLVISGILGATIAYSLGLSQGMYKGYAQRVFYEVTSCITKGYLCPSGNKD